MKLLPLVLVQLLPNQPLVAVQPMPLTMIMMMMLIAVASLRLHLRWAHLLSHQLTRDEACASQARARCHRASPAQGGRRAEALHWRILTMRMHPSSACLHAWVQLLQPLPQEAPRLYLPQWVDRSLPARLYSHV